MNYETLIDKFYSNEILIKQIKEKIYKNKIDLESLACSFTLDVDCDEVMDKEFIFAKILMVKITIQHFMNVYHNSEYFKEMSKNIIVNQPQKVVQDSLNDGNAFVNLLLQYIVLYNLLSKENIVKQSALEYVYCNNNIEEEEEDKCSICDVSKEDDNHIKVFDQIRTFKDNILKENKVNIDGNDESSEYSKIFSHDRNNYGIFAHNLTKDDLRIKEKEYEDKLVNGGEIKGIHQTEDNGEVKCLYCDTMISMDEDKCNVCDSDKVESFEHRKKYDIVQSKINITYKNGGKGRLYIYGKDKKCVNKSLDQMDNFDVIDKDIVKDWNVCQETNYDTFDVGNVVSKVEEKVNDESSIIFDNTKKYNEEIIEHDIKLPEVTWRCKCGVYNGLRVNNCVQCEGIAPFSDKWVCGKCNFYNGKIVKHCFVCKNENKNVMECLKCKRNFLNISKNTKCDDCCKVMKKTHSNNNSKQQKNNCLGKKWYCNMEFCKYINKKNEKHCKKCGLAKDSSVMPDNRKINNNMEGMCVCICNNSNKIKSNCQKCQRGRIMIIDSNGNVLKESLKETSV